MSKLEIEAKVDNLNEVIAFIDEQLEAADCPMKTQMQIDIAVEELFVNIAHYAYAPNVGQAVITAVLSPDRKMSITFEDSGMPYDPLAKEDPDITLSAEEREIGGLGIYMVKKSMDDMYYEYRDSKNILTIVKGLSK